MEKIEFKHHLFDIRPLSESWNDDLRFIGFKICSKGGDRLIGLGECFVHYTGDYDVDDPKQWFVFVFDISNLDDPKSIEVSGHQCDPPTTPYKQWISDREGGCSKIIREDDTCELSLFSGEDHSFFLLDSKLCLKVYRPTTWFVGEKQYYQTASRRGKSWPTGWNAPDRSSDICPWIDKYGVLTVYVFSRDELNLMKFPSLKRLKTMKKKKDSYCVLKGKYVFEKPYGSDTFKVYERKTFRQLFAAKLDYGLLKKEREDCRKKSSRYIFDQTGEIYVQCCHFSNTTRNRWGFSNTTRNRWGRNQIAQKKEKQKKENRFQMIVGFGIHERSVIFRLTIHDVEEVRKVEIVRRSPNLISFLFDTQFIVYDWKKQKRIFEVFGEEDDVLLDDFEISHDGHYVMVAKSSNKRQHSQEDERTYTLLYYDLKNNNREVFTKKYLLPIRSILSASGNMFMVQEKNCWRRASTGFELYCEQTDHGNFKKMFDFKSFLEEHDGKKKEKMIHNDDFRISWVGRNEDSLIFSEDGKRIVCVFNGGRCLVIEIPDHIGKKNVDRNQETKDLVRFLQEHANSLKKVKMRSANNDWMKIRTDGKFFGTRNELIVPLAFL